MVTMPSGWNSGGTPGTGYDSTTGLTWKNPYYYLTGDIDNPTLIQPLSVQWNSNGVGSVMHVDMNARFDDTKAYIDFNDQLSLYVRTAVGNDLLLYRGRVITKAPRYHNSSDSIGLVCVDAAHEMNDETVWYSPTREVTPAVILRGLFGGFVESRTGLVSTTVVSTKIPSTICQLGDDLAAIDKKLFYYEIAGDEVIPVITKAFDSLGNFVWWLEPAQGGGHALLRFVQRGEGEARTLSLGDGTAMVTTTPNVIEIHGTEDASQVVNSYTGYGAKKRQEQTYEGNDASEDLTLVPGWTQGIYNGNTIDSVAMATPALVGKPGIYEHVGRRFRVPDRSGDWSDRKHLLKLLEAVYNSYTANTGLNEIVDSRFQVWTKDANMEDSGNDWMPYNGKFRIFWENPSDQSSAGTKRGHKTLRPWSKTLPERLYLELDDPVFYDRYQNVRTTANTGDGEGEYPAPGNTDISQVRLTFAYEESDRRESSNFGHMYVKTGKQGTFPRERKGLIYDEGYVWERQATWGIRYDDDGIATGYSIKSVTTRDDTAGFLETLNERLEATQDPKASFDITLWYLDFSWKPGQVITKIENSTDYLDVTWVVESVRWDFVEAKTYLSTSAEVMRL